MMNSTKPTPERIRPRLLFACILFWTLASLSLALEKGDKIIFLGDSITFLGAKENGYVNQIKNKVADEGIDVIGSGFGGHRVPNLQNRLERDVLLKKPTHVVVYIGINDVWHHGEGKDRGTTKEDFKEGLIDIVDRCEAIGAKMVLCTPTVIGEKTGKGENTNETPYGTFDWDDMLDAYAKITRDLATERRLLLVDLRDDFRKHILKNNKDNKERGILTRDRVHLNDEGNTFVADKILSVLHRAQFAVPSKSVTSGVGPTRFDRGWFQRLWERKRSAWAKEVEAKQGAVVFLGDSITQGWRDDFRGLFGEDVNFANRGISGDTTRGMRFRLAEDVLALNPAGVIILAGTNDVEDNGSPEDGRENMKAILDALTEHNPDMPIIFNRIFPSSETKRRSPEDIAAFNKIFDALVKGNSQITVIDTWTYFAEEGGEPPKNMFPDLLHLNDAGYAAWAKALRPVLEAHDLLDSPVDDFDVEEGFVPLFNGKDLTGWGVRKTPPRKKPKKPNPNRPVFAVHEKDEAFAGLEVSPDGRYLADDGRLVVTTPTEGRRIQQLWTTEEFERNFHLKLEFRAGPNADSGIFVRGKQLQCRDYWRAGPYNDLEGYKPQEWNTIEIVVKDTTAHCTCNGVLLENAMPVPAKGAIGLEGDRGQMEYRRIRLRDLQPK